jgi:branched-chain amino acid transport system permease protein
MVVLQVIIEGFATGTVYAGLALALVLVYRMTGVVNFAQGEMGMFGAFVIWWLSQNGLSIYTAMAIGLACSFFLVWPSSALSYVRLFVSANSRLR